MPDRPGMVANGICQLVNVVYILNRDIINLEVNMDGWTNGLTDERKADL